MKQSKRDEQARGHGHTALYRKYRPQSFKDVIGQDHVVKVLENSIASGTIAHAYLFAGSRGTGKTSVARIFAHEIGTSEHDLYEMDAASNRGIDDIREIREGVNTVPFESKYKVYIIDEVHMLTKEAFNALLKTLEEPPAHAIFILATTETDKLPETVVSRCQTFTFKKPNQEILREVVLSIAKKEGSALEPAAADLIALLGDGSFRDTQGILQKVLAAGAGISGGKKESITLADAELVTGAPRSEIVRGFISALSERSADAGLKAIAQAVEANVDMKVFAKLVLEKMRFVLLLTHAPDMATVVQSRVSPEEFIYLKSIKNISLDTLLEVLKASQLIGRAFIPQLPLELAIMNIAKSPSQ
jgi:DNA polymerase-3 subunit gamma/tau